MKPRQAWSRIYADFIMPSRLPAYGQLLESALRADYAVASIDEFWKLIVDGAVEPARRYLVLRHDIDTDAATARRMWQIEQSIGIRGSYFFRLSTVDLTLVSAINAGGAHASYHYEELATLAKLRRARSREDAMRLVPEAQDLFRANLEWLRATTGLPIHIVASHGDFMNRRLGVPNLVILDDRQYRRAIGIELETYDDEFMRFISSRHSDTLHPVYWIPSSPLDAIQQGEPVIYLLVHTRHWRVNRAANALDDVRRLGESLLYRLPLGRRNSSEAE
jgi:hypothetical protein